MTTTAIARTFSRVLNPGTVLIGKQKAQVFVKISYQNRCLSLTGVQGPLPSGNCRGSCGQIQLTIEPGQLGEGWTRTKLDRLINIWEKYHLNDMQAGCEHQRADWDTTSEIEVVTYKLTSEARIQREAAEELATEAAIIGRTAILDNTEKALLACEWWRSIPNPPDADSPLSGCYEVDKRETKTVSWVYEKEHPRGILAKACEVCGYKYGSEWRRMDVPPEILDELEAMPKTQRQPAWF